MNHAHPDPLLGHARSPAVGGAGGRLRRVALAVPLLCACAGTGRAGGQEWRIEAALGLAYDVPLPLTVEQRGEEPIRLTGRFATRALAVPLYWVVRVERSLEGRSWGLELIHDKLYLRDPPEAIERFQVSHGFNLVSVIRGWSCGRELSCRAGLGVVVGHPENTVRGRPLPEDGGPLGGGYHLAGPLAQVAVGRREGLAGGLSAFAEGKLVGAHVRLPVVDGAADFWHLSGHALLGLSQRF